MLSTHYLRILFLRCHHGKNKNRFIGQKRLFLTRAILWHGCGVFVNAWCVKAAK
jgi:hypothetical protein